MGLRVVSELEMSQRKDGSSERRASHAKAQGRGGSGNRAADAESRRIDERRATTRRILGLDFGCNTSQSKHQRAARASKYVVWRCGVSISLRMGHVMDDMISEIVNSIRNVGQYMLKLFDWLQ